MIYLDNGATSLHKPPQVAQAAAAAIRFSANPGRGGYPSAMAAAKKVFQCREQAGKMFGCRADQVVFTSNCTHGLNIAINSLAGKDSRVVISGFEHNAVVRPLHGLGAQIIIAGRKLFDWEDTLDSFETALKNGADAAVFTHVSNVFGYILPVEEMAALCRRYGVPFAVDAAQSAGSLPVNLEKWGADFIAMPGHKGLLGPQGTGLLLCARQPKPLIYGGTGSESLPRQMPEDLPERLEAGTVNVPGIAGLSAGLSYLQQIGLDKIRSREQAQGKRCGEVLQDLGLKVFTGKHQLGTVSFLAPGDCESFADGLAHRGIAVRAGLHCAPLAHESAGTLATGTVRVSFGHDASAAQTAALGRALAHMLKNRM